MDKRTPSAQPLKERVRDSDLVQNALARGVREALQKHKQAGNPIAVWRDGHTVWLSPDEIPVADEER